MSLKYISQGFISYANYDVIVSTYKRLFYTCRWNLYVFMQKIE